MRVITTQSALPDNPLIYSYTPTTNNKAHTTIKKYFRKGEIYLDWVTIINPHLNLITSVYRES